jgi:hypothetical protein
LRFRGSANAYLNRTWGTPTNNKIWTYSCWVKLGDQTNYRSQILSSGITGSPVDYAQFQFVGALNYQETISSASALNVSTVAVFRDFAAWYHVTLAVDTTQATATNRVKIYINGVLQALTITTQVAQNTDTTINKATRLGGIGALAYNGSYINNSDGYMADVNFIDGQALTPTSFGTFNSYGVWQPITYGGSYGTNGFYLPFKTNGSTYVGSFSGSWLTLASNTAFNVFGGDMTVECWFNATSVSGSPHLFAFVQDATNRESIYFNSSALTFYSSSSAGSGNRIATSTISTGVWYHYALVKSGSTFTMYLNGVAVGTSTTTQYSTANQSLQIGTYNSGGYGPDNFSGYISNVRVVKGTAVYTSNFIPPTANLSVVTNTQLLTLQNATIIDNSTNAFSITNTNTVTTGQTYPFSASSIFNDQGPQGNNWTPNNISGAVGSTLDYMTDVPTLTSATAANYAVLNPLDKGAATTLTSANLNNDYSGTATDSMSFSSIAFDALANNFYAEFTYVSSGLTGSGIPAVGICDVTTVGTGNISTSGTSVIYLDDGTKIVNGTGSSYGATWTTGDVIGVQINSGTVTFYKNGTTQGNASTGLTGTYKFVIRGRSGASRTFTISANFGQQPFVYTLPTGALRLNTYNL